MKKIKNTFFYNFEMKFPIWICIKKKYVLKHKKSIFSQFKAHKIIQAGKKDSISIFFESFRRPDVAPSDLYSQYLFMLIRMIPFSFWWPRICTSCQVSQFLLCWFLYWRHLTVIGWTSILETSRTFDHQYENVWSKNPIFNKNY